MKRLFSIPLLNPPPLRRESERGRKLPDPIPPLSPPFPEGRGEKIGVSSSFQKREGRGEDIGKRNFPSPLLISPSDKSRRGRKKDILPIRHKPEGEKKRMSPSDKSRRGIKLPAREIHLAFSINQ